MSGSTKSPFGSVRNSSSRPRARSSARHARRGAWSHLQRRSPLPVSALAALGRSAAGRSVCDAQSLDRRRAARRSDDPPLLGFAKSWGFGGVEVVNLFAYRTTDPGELRRVADPVGAEN